MQDALISYLSRIKSLRVTSKTSTLRYQDSGESLPRIGAQLGVAKLIEGSIYRAGTRVRINVQLIDAISDEHIWSESFENEIEDVLALHGMLVLPEEGQVQVCGGRAAGAGRRGGRG